MSEISSIYQTQSALDDNRGRRGFGDNVRAASDQFTTNFQPVQRAGYRGGDSFEMEDIYDGVSSKQRYLGQKY